MSISTKAFGVDSKGRQTTLYTLTNASGASISVLDFGAVLHTVKVPDRGGKLIDVCVGFDDIDCYEKGLGSVGATIGRFGNRIGNACFTLNGVTYNLYANDGKNTLHGGLEGFNKKLWEAETVESKDEDAVVFTYLSADGEENFPGNMKVQVTYVFDNTNKITIRYRAQSDKDTVINLTNHSYFNLDGEGVILDHKLQVLASAITDVDDGLIPTGEYFAVKGSPLDMTEGKKIGDAIAQRADCHYIDHVNGFDCNFCLDEQEGLHKAAVLCSEKSGIVMTCNTTEPGIQVYTGQGLHFKGKNGADYAAYAGVALETQHYPDSPNKPQFPTTTLKAGDTFESVTEYAFTAL